MQHVGRNCLIDYKQRKGRWEKIKYTGLKRRRIGIEKFTFQNEYTFRNLDKSKNIFLEIFARSAKRLWNFQPPCSCQNAIQTWRKSKVRWNIYIFPWFLFDNFNKSNIRSKLPSHNYLQHRKWSYFGVMNLPSSLLFIMWANISQFEVSDEARNEDEAENLKTLLERIDLFLKDIQIFHKVTAP